MRAGIWVAPAGLIGLLAFVGVAGCAEVNCAALTNEEERDWCTYEQVGAYADHDQEQQAIESVLRISSPVVRAAATDRLLESAGDGMQLEGVRALCSNLSGADAAGCSRTWERAHLWGP